MCSPGASRQEIEDEFAAKVARCQARYRVEADAILRARKHLSPLAPLIRSRELLADIYKRETAEIATIMSEQAKRFRSEGLEVHLEQPTPRPAPSSSSGGPGNSPVKSPSALEAAELDYLRLPTLPESVASAKRKTCSPNQSPGESPDNLRTPDQILESDRIRRESLEYLKLPTPTLSTIDLHAAEPAYDPPKKRARIAPIEEEGNAEKRSEIFQRLVDFAQALTEKEEDKDFLEKIQAEFDAVNRR